MAESWVEKQSGTSAPKGAEFASPNLRESGGWVERQSGVAAPERAKSYSERIAADAAVAADLSTFDKTEYFAVPYVNGRVRENDYSEIPAGGGGGNLPFQLSGSGNSWSVSGGYINRNKVGGASFTGRNLEVWIDVVNKEIVASTKSSGLYVPIGRVVNGVADSWLSSNIITSKESNTNSDGTANNCPFYYWGV